jgi:L-asparagine transporter-like permease
MYDKAEDNTGLRCIQHADILKRTYLCQVSDTGSPEPLVYGSYCLFLHQQPVLSSALQYMTKLRTTQAVDTETNNMIHKVWTLQCMTKLKTTQAVDTETNNMIHKVWTLQCMTNHTLWIILFVSVSTACVVLSFVIHCSVHTLWIILFVSVSTACVVFSFVIHCSVHF